MVATTPSAPRIVRFGVFEVDLRSGELCKQGLKIKLHGQPVQILALLLERPGELVTREELKEKLWSADTFVDFEHGLNAAVKKLRAALEDSADNPRFVETLPRRGYRFIPPVEGVERAPERARRVPRWVAALALVGLPGVLVALLALNVGGLRHKLLGRPAPGQITSIAVLPLENLSGDPEQEYFVDGMTETLITELSKIGALTVISRQSVMQFKGTEKPLPEIARELNVDAVVEGSALHIGERVRITVQLIEAGSDRNIWAENYDRELSNVLALHSEVARAIARQIKVTLTPTEETRLAATRAVNPKAYEAYLRGQFYFQQWTPTGIQLAREHFQRAVELAPQDPLAYVGLAETHYLHAELPPMRSMPIAREFAMKALELDDTLGEAHSVLASIKFFYEWDWAGAEEEFQRALELSPGYAQAHHMYSHFLMAMGRFDESLVHSLRAVEMDPLLLGPGMQVHLGRHYRAAGQFDQAIEHFRKLIESHPTSHNAHSQLGAAYWGRGMPKEAITALEKAMALERAPWTIAWLGHIYARTGRTQEAENLLEELKAESRKRYIPHFWVAGVYAGLDQTEQAFEWLERGYQERNPQLARQLNLKNSVVDILKPDPRYHSLLRRMNFPE
jgi:TolB-like protein/DNA-binding winged helix-turn-helix (wHTH) protein/Tfp pilus assembly protein PilF